MTRWAAAVARMREIASVAESQREPEDEDTATAVDVLLAAADILEMDDASMDLH